MKSARGLASVGMFLGAVSVLAAWFSVSTNPAAAEQNSGMNAICTTTPGCLPTAPSPAFIDAIGYGQGSDICDTIYGIFSNRNTNAPPYPATGAVIDARGITSNLSCATGKSPWLESSGYLNKPSTILLPSGTIKIPTTWVLPGGTTLVGQETTDPALNYNGSILQTTIQAISPGFTGAMLQFGDSTHCVSSVCSDITVEHLTLDGNNQAITGILNQNSRDRSHVNRVTLPLHRRLSGLLGRVFL